ncbi:MAG: hypothetical protein WC825_11130 [Gallionellaceae bacterium]|jgi:hypothetical protein
MRIKSNWFKPGREHTPEELAGALSFVIYRIADDALKNTRKAKFEVAVGTQYFAFLTEFLLFLIQIADRIAFRRLSEEDRFTFTSELANRIAETHAENESRLLGGELAECKRRFIDRLNQRAGEYAEFGYDESGPDFSFTRYLAFCMDEVVDEKDSGWIIDQMMSIAAPEAVDMVEKTFRNLLESEPRQPRRRASTSGD